MSWGGRRVPGLGKKIGRTPNPKLTEAELQALIQEQAGLCALCAEPGSVGGLEVDFDGLRKSVRGMLHPKCKAFLALGHDNPRRFQMAIAYLEQRAAAPPRVIVRPLPAAVPKSPENPGTQVIASVGRGTTVSSVPQTSDSGTAIRTQSGLDLLKYFSTIAAHSSTKARSG